MPTASSRPSSLMRSFAGAVALSLATPAVSVAGPGVALQMRSAAPDESEIERLFVEGQDRYADGDFSGAADSWTRLLQQLSEKQANKATRENVLLNVLQAYLDAYNRTRAEDGSKDIEHLRAGKKVLDAYYNDYHRAYGDRASVSAAVQEKGDDLERQLDLAEKDITRGGATGGDGGGEGGADEGGDDGALDDGGDDGGEGGDDGGDDGGPKVVVLKSESAGTGLIVGGTIAAVVGVGMFGMGIAGVVVVNRAEDDLTTANTQDEIDTLTRKGETGQALAIAGFVVGGVGLAAGATLLALGFIKRKKAADDAASSITVAPSVGPRFSGLSLSGRF